MSLLQELLLLKEQQNKAPKLKKPKPRPPKNLWFQDRNFWLLDLHREHQGRYQLCQDEEEETIVATDPDEKLTYGVWRPRENKGITFFKPRPLHTAVHPKAQLKRIQ